MNFEKNSLISLERLSTNPTISKCSSAVGSLFCEYWNALSIEPTNSPTKNPHRKSPTFWQFHMSPTDGDTPAALYASKVELSEGIRLNNLSIIEVEDLLYELFENEKIESSVFQKHFDIIFDMKKEDYPDLDILKKIYKELKT